MRPRPPTRGATKGTPWAVHIPVGVEIATQWAWRLLVVVAASGAVGYLLLTVQVIVIPILLAVLLTALIVPIADVLTRRGVTRSVAAAVALVGTLVVVAGLLTLVGQQIATGFSSLEAQVSVGIGKVQDWLATGPLQISSSQLSHYYDQLRNAITSGGTGFLARGALEVTTTVTHVVTGFLLTLFCAYFFLYDGARIWSWFVRLFPRMARDAVDGAARSGWVSLTAFVRGTVLVALADAVGIAIVAVILRVPLALPIGVLVFLTAFVPIVGAFVSGAVAVLVALVAHGPVVALIMLGGVLAVNELEAHVLQPFVMGRLVRLHPLAIVLAVATGAFVAGIVGALFAVPLAAFANAVVGYLASRADAPGTAAAAAGATAGTAPSPALASPAEPAGTDEPPHADGTRPAARRPVPGADRGPIGSRRGG